MSLHFNDTTGHQGIIQVIEDEIGLRQGEISDNPRMLTKFTADVNIAFGELLAYIFNVGGTWQWDDSDHDTYPILTSDIHVNQQDYSFIEDAEGNLILDIFKVLFKDRNGKWHEGIPVDRQSEKNTQDFSDQIVGDTLEYDKTANGIFLRRLPPENIDNGIQILVGREQTFFTTTDTTKKPGIDARIHRFLALHPAYRYAVTKRLPQKNDLYLQLYGRNERDKTSLKYLAKSIYSRREKDVVRRLIPNVENTR